MAKRTVTTLIDDKDGSAADESFYFTYAGVEYRLDLSSKNAAAFRKDLGKWARIAQRQGRAGGTRKSAPAVRREEHAVVRQWAEANGWPISNRGQVPGSVIQAYREANG